MGIGGIEGGGTLRGGAGRVQTPKENGMAPPVNLPNIQMILDIL